MSVIGWYDRIRLVATNDDIGAISDVLSLVALTLAKGNKQHMTYRYLAP